MSKGPVLLDVGACAAVVMEFARVTIQVRGLPLKQPDISRRTVLLMVTGAGPDAARWVPVLRWAQPPNGTGRGHRGYLDAVEASVLACVWMVQAFYGLQAGSWAARYLNEALRSGLRYPARRMALQVHEGVAAVVPMSDVSRDAPMVLELSEIRAIVDSIIQRLGYGASGGGSGKVLDMKAFQRAAVLTDEAVAALEARV